MLKQTIPECSPRFNGAILKFLHAVLYCSLMLSVLFNSGAVAQDSTVARENLLAVHAGVDAVAKGFHVGVSVRIEEQVLLEAAFGRDVLEFLIGEDASRRFSVGVRWYPKSERAINYSITYSYADFIRESNISKQHLVSGLIGSRTGVFGAFSLYYRAGLTLSFKHNNAGFSVLAFPNIDVGLSVGVL